MGSDPTLHWDLASWSLVLGNGISTFSDTGIAGGITSTQEAGDIAFFPLTGQNTSPGATASTDNILGNDIATDNTNYMDMGINSSNNADPLYTAFGVNGAYWYNVSGELALATQSNFPIKFFTGGTLATNESARLLAGALTLGLTGTTAGALKISGLTSGLITIKGAAIAGTYTLTLPPDDGTVGQHLRTDGNGILTWETPSVASGNVVGPASATDNAIARFDATTGKLLQDSVATISDAGALTIFATGANDASIGANSAGGAGNAVLRADAATAKTAYLRLVSGTTLWDFQVNDGVSSGAFRFIFNSANSAMVIDGISPTSPALHVASTGIRIVEGTATPAGGTAALGYRMGSAGVGIFFGSGAPTLSAAQGSIYLRTDGGVNTRVYANTNGTTGWTPLSNAA